MYEGFKQTVIIFADGWQSYLNTLDKIMTELFVASVSVVLTMLNVSSARVL